MNHVEHARAIYTSLRAMRMADMSKDEWELFLALENVFDAELIREREREEAAAA